MGVVGEPPRIALEVPVVDEVEAKQRDQQPDVGLGDAAVGDEQVHENTARIHLAEVTRWHGESGYQAAGEYAIAPHSGHARYEWAARQLTAAVEAAREYLEGR